MKRNVSWSKDEINLLKEKAGIHSIQSIAYKLNRSPHAVHSKLNRLGFTSIRELNGSLSLMQLAKALGVSRCVVERWIHQYELPASQRNYYFKSNKVKHYSIYPDQFWKWAEQHKDLINFAKIEPYSILPEPAWLEEERKKDSVKPKRDKKNWSDKEDRKLLEMRKAGKSYKEIAEILGRSERSVQGRVGRLRKKMGIKLTYKMNE